MKTYSLPGENLPLEKTAVAIGFFDGVHLGHRSLIRLARQYADERGLPLCVFTFPSESTAIKPSVPRIGTTAEKLRIFEKLHVDITVLCDFSFVKNMTAADFVQSILIENLHASLVVTGNDFRLGMGAATDTREFRRLLDEQSIAFAVCPTYLDGDEPLSSSRIRDLLACGKIEEANRLLGEPISVCGEVLHGISLAGRQGIPTINLQSDKFALFLPGVYRSETDIVGKRYVSVTNIGTCPTVGGRKLHAETHLIGFSGDLYGTEVEIHILEFVRPEMNFPPTEMLFRQIKADIQKIVQNKETGG